MKIARRAHTHAAQSALFVILAQVRRKAKYARTLVVGQFGVAPRLVGAVWGCAGLKPGATKLNCTTSRTLVVGQLDVEAAEPVPI
jgi:hypothetical protein